MHEGSFLFFIFYPFFFYASRRSHAAKQMLVSAVQSGELDLPAYCEILRERVVRDKVSLKTSTDGEVTCP